MPTPSNGRAWPAAALVLALATVFLFGGDRERFYRSFLHDWNSARWLAITENLSFADRLPIERRTRRDAGTIRHDLYGRFPIGGFLLIKLVTVPFEGDPFAQVLAARMLMLTLFGGAALLAYCGLARLVRHRPTALGATLLGFSSYYMLLYSDMICTEGVVDLFAVTLAFHGMAAFEARRARAAGAGPCGQLLVKTSVALLLGWHVLALLLPFIALGLASELRRARGSAAGSWPARWLARGRRAARSRYALLGLCAALVSAGSLAHNLASERAALGSERAWTDLPTARAALKRFGGNETVNAMIAEELRWPNFLALQFHRIGGMTLPFALPGPRNARGELPWGGPVESSRFLVIAGALGTVACFVGLALTRLGGRPLIALALAGFCWALALRHNTAELPHEHESLFYLGVPLTLFLLLGQGWRRAFGHRAGAAFGLVAVPVFAASSWQMAKLHEDATAAAFERPLAAELQAIRATARGKDVLIAGNEAALYRFLRTPRRVRARDAYTPMMDGSGRWAFYYYMAGSVLRYADRLDAAAIGATDMPPDFVLAFERFDVPSLLTPANRFVFLYDGLDALAAMASARLGEYAAFAAKPLAARSVWTIHAPRGELVYLKAPCRMEDTLGRYFLKVRPARPPPAWQAGAGADGQVSLHIAFSEHGTLFGDKCMMRFALPDYPVRAVKTGQFGPRQGPLIWHTAFYLDLTGLRRAYEATRGNRPIGRRDFDVYDAGHALVYVKEQCSAADTRERFFLHLFAASPGDFHNLDFDFAERGARFDGRCVAVADLPNQRVTQARTGQFTSDGAKRWELEFKRTPVRQQ